jgi:hypothetical protein
MVLDANVVRSYTDEKLSEMQTAVRYGISANRVRRILDKYCVQRRSIRDAIVHLNVTKYGKRPFVLKTDLSEEERIIKTIGVMLYWGEGTKRGGTATLSNSDPAMICVYLVFLRRICGIDEKRLRVGVHYYDDHDPRRLVAFWSKKTGIPISQFDRPFLHRAGKGSYKTKSQYGTVSVRYSDTRLLGLLNGWIREYQELFLK